MPKIIVLHVIAVTKDSTTRNLFAKGFRDILVHKTWDYSKPWTDANLYEYFDLNEEEIATIEEETKE